MKKRQVQWSELEKRIDPAERDRFIPKRNAFTVIELLVVVTIIVILLALLTPALDKAIYQAELAVCGTSLKAIVTGVQQYAFAHHRHYPHREAIWAGSYPRPNLLKWGADAQVDDRGRLAGYVVLEQLLDPLNGRGVIDLSPEASRPTTHVYANYYMWWDWGYGTGAKSSRVGRRFEWVDKPFGILVSDMDLGTGGGWHFANHADSDAILSHEVGQDRDYTGAGDTGEIGGVAGYAYTLSRWSSAGLSRGTVDLNYGFGDGSVRRLTQVGPNDADTTGRTAKVGDATYSTDTTGTYIQVMPR